MARVPGVYTDVIDVGSITSRCSGKEPARTRHERAAEIEPIINAAKMKLKFFHRDQVKFSKPVRPEIPEQLIAQLLTASSSKTSNLVPSVSHL